MRTARFFCETIVMDAGVSISDVQFRHLTKVLRFSKGDCVELFDGKGTVAQAVIEKITKDAAQLKIQSLNTLLPPENRRIIIASSEAKAQRFELIIAKCTELGIDRITPIIFERTVKQPHGQNTLRRYDLIAVESAKQCERNFLPIIDSPQTFKQALENLPKQYPNAKIIFGSLIKGAISVISIGLDSRDVIAFIGPEGGITESEEKTLKDLNAIPVRLTNTVLRIETAAIATAAVLAANRDLRE